MRVGGEFGAASSPSVARPWTDNSGRCRWKLPRKCARLLKESSHKLGRCQLQLSSCTYNNNNGINSGRCDAMAGCWEGSNVSANASELLRNTYWRRQQGGVRKKGKKVKNLWRFTFSVGMRNPLQQWSGVVLKHCTGCPPYISDRRKSKEGKNVIASFGGAKQQKGIKLTCHRSSGKSVKSWVEDCADNYC